MSWIQSKAGLQMAETIIRYLPRTLRCLEKLVKDNPVHKYRDDIIHIAEQMDIRKQENINLKFQLDETKSKLSKLDEQYSHYLDLTNDRLNTLESIIEERK